MEEGCGQQERRTSILTCDTFAAAKRQAAAAAGQPTVQEAAMTNQAGQVIAFDSKNVYLDSVAKGL